MSSAISTIINKSIRKPNDRHNILSFVTHERFQSNLGGCNANFYLIQKGDGIKGNWITNYAPIPRNTIILPPINDPLQAVSWVDFTAVMSMHKFGQYQLGRQIANHLGLPLIQVEHTCPTSDSLRRAVPQLKELRGDINVFISDTSRSQWGFSSEEAEVIEHGIDTNFFKPSGRSRKNQILTVGNDFINRGEILGFDTLQRVCNELPLKVVGDTAGLSQPAKNLYELKGFYDESLLYINPSRFSPIPMSLLEAMASACCVVTTDNNLISSIVENGVNGIITNDEFVMRKEIQRLLNDKDECVRLGDAARNTILSRFPLDKFFSSYDEVFERAARL